MKYGTLPLYQPALGAASASISLPVAESTYIGQDLLPLADVGMKALAVGRGNPEPTTVFLAIVATFSETETTTCGPHRVYVMKPPDVVLVLRVALAVVTWDMEYYGIPYPSHAS